VDFERVLEMRLILYGTDFCQLCDEALALIEDTLAEAAYELEIVDISSSDELMAQYAYSIPVLRRMDNEQRELSWPFSASQIREFVGQ
jgi:hypothetical protein